MEKLPLDRDLASNYASFRVVPPASFLTLHFAHHFCIVHGSRSLNLHVKLLTMPSRRMLKVAEAIREVVSMAILAELKDPRVMGVTVTRAEVTPTCDRPSVRLDHGGRHEAKTLLARTAQLGGFLAVEDRV